MTVSTVTGGRAMARYNSEFMSRHREKRFFGLICVCLVILAGGAVALTSWDGLLIDSSGKPVPGAVVRLHSTVGTPFETRSDTPYDPTIERPSTGDEPWE